jgi:hypothetical protein
MALASPVDVCRPRKAAHWWTIRRWKDVLGEYDRLARLRGRRCAKIMPSAETLGLRIQRRLEGPDAPRIAKKALHVLGDAKDVKAILAGERFDQLRVDGRATGAGTANARRRTDAFVVPGRDRRR